ncbi:MAG: DUF1993 domain-containing protein [Pseudomonadales bacterium]|nr:DUF1993 domain-containing protein [Pseudomonadales bacterium]
MSVSLFDLSVGSYIQALEGATGFLKKGAVYCAGNGISLDDVVDTCLYPDMLKFRFQVVCMAHHSLGAIKGLQKGVFEPPAGYPEADYPGLQELIAITLDELKAMDHDAVNSLSGGKLVFKIGKNQIPFTAENFVMSFSLPNLYFHLTTAYDILRIKGVPLGKIDFLGPMRVGA